MKFRFGKNKTREGRTVGFSDIMPGLINQFDIKKEFTIETLEAKWPIISGDIMSKHSKPRRIAGKTLIVECDHPVFANELAMFSDIIITKIEDELGPGIVKKIRVETKKR